MNAAAPNPLARCFGPDGAGGFADHWQVGPLLGRDRSGRGFTDLLSINSVDELLADRALRHPAFRLVRAGEPVPRSAYTVDRRMGATRYEGVVDPGRLAAEIRGGATLVLQSLHQHWAPLGTFCAALHETLGHPVQANAYLTPPGERGLDLHYDTHDVLVLHVDGTKRWEIFEPRFEQPLGFQHWRDVAPAGVSLDDGELQPALDVRLGPGDCLYLPRGFVHRAVSDDEPSLHVTVGIHAITWYHVLRDGLGPAAERADVRAAIPPGVLAGVDPLDRGHLASLMGEVLRTADLDERLRTFQRASFSQYAGHHRGVLTEVVRAEPLDDAVVVEPRPLVPCELVVVGDRCELRLSDRIIRLPATAAPALEAILQAHCPTTIASLAPLLDESSRVVVVRRLLQEGVVRRVAGNG